MEYHLKRKIARLMREVSFFIVLNISDVKIKRIIIYLNALCYVYAEIDSYLSNHLSGSCLTYCSALASSTTLF